MKVLSYSTPHIIQSKYGELGSGNGEMVGSQGTFEVTAYKSA